MVQIRFGNKDSDKPSGRIGTSIVCLIFFLVGLLFLVAMGGMTYKTLQTFSWKTTTCTVVKREVVQSKRSDEEMPYELVVSYRYNYQGREFRGDKVSTERNQYSSYSEAERAAEAYSPNSTRDCYVDPDDPTEAILNRGWHSLLFFGIFMIVPIIFMAVGGFGIYSAWSKPKDPGPKSLSARSNSQSQLGEKVLVLIFGIIFTLVGAAVLWPLGIKPILEMQDAESWPAADCTVIHSKVRYHSGDSDSGPTYSVDILYSYTVNGIEYKSDRYTHFGGSSSGRKSKQQIVDQYPPGHQFSCYYNPERPSTAVINRGFSWTALLGLIPLVFLFFGLAMLYGYFFKKRTTFTIGTEHRPLDDQRFFTETELRPQMSNLAKLIGISIFAIIWNGAISLFIFEGDGGLFANLFMIPFVLVGLGLILASIYCLLSLWNPVPVLRLSTTDIRLGEEFSFEWEFTGKMDRVRDLNFTLIGKEEAQYTRGTDTVTEHNKFYQQIVFTAYGQGHTPRTGTASCTVPDYLMHSFEAENNKIIWEIEVHAEIPKWPDVKETFLILVGPK